MIRSVRTRLLLIFFLLIVFCWNTTPCRANTHEIFSHVELSSGEKNADGSSAELKIRLPVRVIAPMKEGSGIDYLENLHKDDFTLMVNEQKRPILDFSLNRRSITRIEGERQFVLYFDASDYSEILSGTVIYFVKNILKPADRLFICSPLHTYRIDPKFAKADIIEYIKTNLNKDFRQWKDKKNKAFDNLEQMINTLGKKLAVKRIGMNSILLFINNFTYQWRKFDREFLLSGLEYLPEIASLLAQQEGEKWIIQFQERDLLPLLGKFKNLAKDIKRHLASLPKSYKKDITLIGSSLDKIEQSLLFEEEFPLEDLLNALLGVNIDYNIIFLNGNNYIEKDRRINSVIPGFERILSEVARKSGGICLYADAADTNPEKVINTLSQHKDVYYNLAFSVGNEPGDRKIEILLDKPEAELYYKRKFKKEEIKWLKEWVKQEIGLSGISLEGNRLSFTISGFKIKTDSGSKPGQGLVKVEIRLIDDKNTIIYQTANTLKPVETEINISLNLPDRYKGYFKLSLDVRDLAAGKNCQVKKYIKL